jgi:hypothetical protein
MSGQDGLVGWRINRMARRTFVALVVPMLALAAWGVFFENNAFSIVINGKEVTGPLKGAIGAGGMLVALIALLCAATLLVLVFAGVGIVVLGLLILVGAIGLAAASPMLLTLLIPVAIVWLVVAMAGRRVWPRAMARARRAPFTLPASGLSTARGVSHERSIQVQPPWQGRRRVAPGGPPGGTDLAGAGLRAE